jgi:D-glycero-beta-D-manno-heptose 1-phosphate adenylyltransferase
MSTENWVKLIEDMERISEILRGAGKTIVTTNGSFDMMHLGHMGYLDQASKLGDNLVVLVNSDESVRGNKDPRRPIEPEEVRADSLTYLESVSYVVIFPQSTPLEYLERIRPNIHVKGGSFEPERIAEERALVESWGGRFLTLPFVGEFSTTRTIKTIVERYGAPLRAPEA